MKILDVVQRSAEWRVARLGLPTASEFSRLVTSKGAPSTSLSGYANELAAEIFAGQPIDAFEGNVWTARGADMEAEAIRLYNFMNDAEVVPVGFVTDDAGTYGCSPDGFVGDEGMIEIKCLKIERHIAAMTYFQKHKVAPTDYVQQTQGEILVCERAWVDLCFYHPDMPLFTLRQTPGEMMQAALKKGITDVLQERDDALEMLRATGA